MKSMLHITAAGLILALSTGTTWADKPSWAGHGKHKEGKERSEENEQSVQSSEDNKKGPESSYHFGRDDRKIVAEYYGTQARKGKCPPGLAKKNNGCLPPGQAKKWQKNHPLAKDIKYHELPKALSVKLPAPPANHRYVQVAGDILMIAIGTSLVVDAIEDILR